ncbi:MAG: flagellar hook capping FlgD N-terminal domain-containing protein [Thermodesulfobacteriota bacterium]|nr:flagellar hook capping FlgD N-terminal domain-containing protein [Thermodesulfobacteriota bacterium]
MSVGGLEAVKMAQSTSPDKKNSVMDKDDFLRLLVTQLEAQDPLNPLESTEFTAQLAQFSSLEQLYTINDNMENLQLYQAAVNNVQAVSLIGKTVKVPGNAIHMMEGASNPIHFQLAEDAASVFVNIYDPYGSLAKTIEAGPLKAGQQTLDWDTTDNGGEQMADGDYSFEVFAVDANEQIVESTPLFSGTVTDVVFREGTAWLLAGTMEIPIGSVLQVTERED